MRILALGLLLAAAAPLAAQDAEALRARHAGLREALAAAPFGRPLHLESRQNGAEHAGEVYAELDRPFAAVKPALDAAQEWCAILVLPANVKRCEPSASGLALFVARRPQDAVEDAYRVDFRYELARAAPDYLRVALRSPSGPFGTTDYRIGLELVPLGEGRTFLHMSYAYSLGFMARMGMQGYLATAGRDKVGFTVVGRDAQGRPVHVEGLRGVLERNAMRYYLAIEAHLGSLAAPPGERLEHRLRSWYGGIERYPRQLREEIRRDEYLRIKLSEAQR
jgi:hypothetical protein